jgi:hypothetical protein
MREEKSDAFTGVAAKSGTERDQHSLGMCVCRLWQ